MSATQVLCPGCSIPLPAELINTDGPQPCPSCRSRIIAVAFPALIRPIVHGQAAERVVMPDEAACFYHPAKKAAIPCGSCGRFLCALCDIAIEDRHICSGCLESGMDKGQLETLETSRVRYDSIALSVAVLPLLIFWLTLITAPIALYYCIRYWNSPQSVVRSSKATFIVAALFAVLELIGWGIFFVYLAGR